MIQSIIAASIRHKGWVLAGVILWACVGIYSIFTLKMDAVPDITNQQVTVTSISGNLTASEMEELITQPLERKLLLIPELQQIRSISRYGLSVITLIFKENTDLLVARQLVSEQLQAVDEFWPTGIPKPEMLPITTGLGEVYQYRLFVNPSSPKQYNLHELRQIQDYLVKPLLAGVPGLVEISSFGGYSPNIIIEPNLEQMNQQGIGLNELEAALKKNQVLGGGGYENQLGINQFFSIDGRLKTPEQLKQTVVSTSNGQSIILGQMAQIYYGGKTLRFGALTSDGQGEAVGGIALMLKGENALEVSQNLAKRAEELQKKLPPGISLQVFLDRSILIEKTLKTVRTNLLEGGLIVIAVLMIFLGHLRGGLLVASVIPLSLLFAASIMKAWGISGNLMSLGAVDFGLMVDGAIVLVEGVLQALHKSKLKPQSPAIFTKNETTALARPALFGQLIILAVYIPILALEGIEGKMFKPMAITVMLGMTGAIILSLTFIPAATAFWVAPKADQAWKWSERLTQHLQLAYIKLLSLCLKKFRWIIAGVVTLLLTTGFVFYRQGTVFIPTLEEGDLAIQMSMVPGTPLDSVIQMAGKVERHLMTNFPEVTSVVSKIGSSEVPTDPMGLEDSDIMVLLKPKKEWETASHREALVDSMKSALSVFRNAEFDFSQPIQLRFNELLSGSKSDLMVKVFGENPNELRRISAQIENLAAAVQGAADVKLEKTLGLPLVKWQISSERCALYQVSPEDVLSALTFATSGANIGRVRTDNGFFEIIIRLTQYDRAAPDRWRTQTVTNSAGQHLPLGLFVDPNYESGEILISRERGQRRIAVNINIRNRDVASVVTDLEEAISQNIVLPPGYSIEFGGDFENLERAKKRLALALPIALGLIFILLWQAVGKISDALSIFFTIPLASIGGVLGLEFAGLPFSISAAIGFIALFGIAVLNGLVMVNSFHAKDSSLPSILNVFRGSSSRVRPVLMTAAVASMGFLPMILASGAGAEVQRPLAIVVVSGLITSTLLTLVVLPSIFVLRRKWGKNAKAKTQIALLLIFGIPLGSFSQTSPKDFWKLTEQNSTALGRIRESENKVKLDAKPVWNFGQTNINYQRGQINSASDDYFLTFEQNWGNPFQSVWQNGQRKYQAIKTQEEIYWEARNKKKDALLDWIFWAETQEKYLTLKTYWLAFLKADSSAQKARSLGTISPLDYGWIQLKGAMLKQQFSESELRLSEMNIQLSYWTGQEWKNFSPDSSFWHVDFNSMFEPLLPLDYFWKTSNKQLATQQKNVWLDHFPAIQTRYFIQQLDGQTGYSGWEAGLTFSPWPNLAIRQKKELRQQSHLDQSLYEDRASIVSTQSQRSLEQYRFALKNWESSTQLHKYLFKNQNESLRLIQLLGIQSPLTVWMQWQDLMLTEIQRIELRSTLLRASLLNAFYTQNEN